MSNFAGVTFEDRIVTPSCDGIVRRAMFTDGILSGCVFSHSGATLTMSAGSLVICGRQIRHTAPTSWPVTDATSGFARLVLTIDLSRTSTVNDFDQVSAEVQYATAQDGFSRLVSGDVNAAGIKYQAVLCVVSLGAGGITGIVSSLPQAGANSRAGLVYASAGSSGSSLALPRGQQVKIPLSQWKVKSEDGFSFSDGGIKLPMDGVILLMASVYFEGISTTSPANVGPYVHLNGVEVAGHLTYSQTISAVHMAPVLIPVEKGDVLTLHGRNVTRDGVCLPSAKMTALSLCYLTEGIPEVEDDNSGGSGGPGNNPSGGGSGSTQVPCTGISLNTFGIEFASKVTSVVGMQQTITATVTPANCTEKVIWTSSDNTVATVDNGVVTAGRNGQCIITVTCGAYSATCSVSVNGKQVKCTGITLDKTAIMFSKPMGGSTVGKQQTLTATVTPENCEEKVYWESSDTSVATVDNGVVTVTGSGGSCVITAYCGGYSATCDVTT